MNTQNNNPVEILKAVSTLPEDILNISQVCKFLGISNTAVRQRILLQAVPLWKQCNITYQNRINKR